MRGAQADGGYSGGGASQPAPPQPPPPPPPPQRFPSSTAAQPPPPPTDLRDPRVSSTLHAEARRGGGAADGRADPRAGATSAATTPTANGVVGAEGAGGGSRAAATTPVDPRVQARGATRDAAPSIDVRETTRREGTRASAGGAAEAATATATGATPVGGREADREAPRSKTEPRAGVARGRMRAAARRVIGDACRCMHDALPRSHPCLALLGWHTLPSRPLHPLPIAPVPVPVPLLTHPRTGTGTPLLSPHTPRALVRPSCRSSGGLGGL